MNKEDILKQICKMISSGDIPKGVYDKYLSKTPLGFMNYEELYDFLKEQNQKYKEVIDKVTNELFTLKDMIYKPETREENFEIQRKISSIIKRLNGKEVE